LKIFENWGYQWLIDSGEEGETGDELDFLTKHETVWMMTKEETATVFAGWRTTWTQGWLTVPLESLESENQSQS
jgi:hypothetical protein